MSTSETLEPARDLVSAPPPMPPTAVAPARDGRTEALWLASAGVVVFVALLLTRLYSYNLFHATAELFSVMVALTIFVIAWNTRHILSNGYFAVVGGTFLAIGLIDVLHTLAYEGMGVFHGFDTDLPTGLWLAARYLQAAALLVAPLVVARHVPIRTVLAVVLPVAALLLASIFWWDVFPHTFIDGEGLTTFKIASEYVISGVLMVALALTVRRRDFFQRRVLVLIVAAIGLTVASELSFTLYSNPESLANLVGHFLKIVAFFLIYKALVETALERPYDVLFRNLKASEEAVRASEQRYREIADSLQESLLDVPDRLDGVEIGHLYRSATRATRVGGDFYDFFALSGDRVGLIVGDVSGKGLKAAAMTAMVKDTIRAYAFDDLSPARVLQKTNAVMVDALDELSFVTAFFGVFDRAAATLRYCSAGHPPAVVLRPDRPPEMLEEHSPVLGAFPDVVFREARAGLEPGELLFLYTDGLTEGRRGAEFYGDERMRERLASLGNTDPSEVIAAMFEDALAFTAGDLRDDIALLALGPAAEPVGDGRQGRAAQTGRETPTEPRAGNPV